MTVGTDALAAELVAARGDFVALLDSVDASRLNAPALVGEWSARELVAHVGYWAGHAVEVIHAAERGDAEGVGLAAPPVDEVNATVARVARQTNLATARMREAASVQALLDRLAALDPALLTGRLGDGATLADGIREDGSAHYREHADALRQALARP